MVAIISLPAVWNATRKQVSGFDCPTQSRRQLWGTSYTEGCFCLWNFIILTGHDKSGKQWDAFLATSVEAGKMVRDLNAYNRYTGDRP